MPKTTKPHKTKRTPSERPRARTSKPPRKAEASAQRPSWLPLAGVVASAIGLVVVGVYVLADHAERVQQERESESEVEESSSAVVPERLVVRVHARHPHKTDAFTQGLVWDHGRLFESTGLEGRSSVREVALETGEVSRIMEDPADVFGEGLALVGTRLVQITWQDHLAFVYDRDTFEKRAEHRYEGEGWGLCNDGTHLVMSDGTSVLRFRNPETFEVERSVSVTRLGRPLRMLNELECVGDDVYANVWQTNDIVRIDARTGTVEAIIDASALSQEIANGSEDVLNGIAYMPERQRFLVTGKLWPKMFEVTFEPARAGR